MRDFVFGHGDRLRRSYTVNADTGDISDLQEIMDRAEPTTRAEQRRRLAESEKCALRLLARVRRPDLLPFASARIAEAIGRIEASRQSSAHTIHPESVQDVKQAFEL